MVSLEIYSTSLTVFVILFRYIETELNLRLAQIRPEVRHYFNEAPPMKRIGQTTDLTGGLIYLLSRASSYVTGIDLAVDGGMSAGTGLTR